MSIKSIMQEYKVPVVMFTTVPLYSWFLLHDDPEHLCIKVSDFVDRDNTIKLRRIPDNLGEITFYCTPMKELVEVVDISLTIHRRSNP